MRLQNIPQGKKAFKILLITLALTASIVTYAETLPQTISTLETAIKVMTASVAALYIVTVSCIYLDTRRARAANDTKASARNRAALPLTNRRGRSVHRGKHLPVLAEIARPAARRPQAESPVPMARRGNRT